jgi:hypothetical protein
MLSYKVWPDGMSVYCDLSGKVHHFVSSEVHEFMLQCEDYRWRHAIISIAGPVAELMAKGIDVYEGEITGSGKDLEEVISLFPDYDDRLGLQQDAAAILESNEKAWKLLARLVHDLGHLYKDDLVDIWYLNEH